VLRSFPVKASDQTTIVAKAAEQKAAITAGSALRPKEPLATPGGAGVGEAAGSAVVFALEFVAVLEFEPLAPVFAPLAAGVAAGVGAGFELAGGV